MFSPKIIVLSFFYLGLELTVRKLETIIENEVQKENDKYAATLGPQKPVVWKTWVM